MASSMFGSLRRSTSLISLQTSSSLTDISSPSSLKTCGCVLLQNSGYAKSANYNGNEDSQRRDKEEDYSEVPTEGISRPLSEILKQLNKKVPDSLIKIRNEDNGFALKYIPWHIVNRILNLHAPEWSGEVRNVIYSADGKSVTVIYRVTLHGTDAEVYRESTGTASVVGKGYGDAVQQAEGMAFRRACARLGLGLHLYHEELS